MSKKKKSKSKQVNQGVSFKKIAKYIAAAAAIATIFQLFVSCTSEPSARKYNMDSSNNNDSDINQIMVEEGDVYINSYNTEDQQSGFGQNILNASVEQEIAYSYDLIQQGKYELAAEGLRTFIDRGNVGPMDMAVLHYNLGVAYYYQEKYAMAKTEAEIAVKTSGFADAYYFLGVISGGVFDDYPEAIEAFSNALQYEMKPEYLLARAWAYGKNGQSREAREDYETYETISAASA